MEGPPLSPDLNCFEHFQSSLKSRIYVDCRQITTNDTLWEALQDALRNILPYEITKYTNFINKMLFEEIPNHENYMNYQKFCSDS